MDGWLTLRGGGIVGGCFFENCGWMGLALGGHYVNPWSSTIQSLSVFIQNFLWILTSQGVSLLLCFYLRFTVLLYTLGFWTPLALTGFDIRRVYGQTFFFGAKRWKEIFGLLGVPSTSPCRPDPLGRWGVGWSRPPLSRGGTPCFFGKRVAKKKCAK